MFMFCVANVTRGLEDCDGLPTDLVVCDPSCHCCSVFLMSTLAVKGITFECFEGIL